jgi:hypothetical protein
MGYADQKRSDNWVNLATLVAAIIRNKFVDHNGGLFQNNTHDSQTPYERIRAIFAEMEQINFPFFINSADKFFLTNRGLRILFRFVNLFYRNETAGNISISFHDTLQLLSKTINLEVKEELKKYYGEGGAKKLSNNLLEYL